MPKDIITDRAVIATIMRRSPTSTLVQTVCGLRTKSDGIEDSAPARTWVVGYALAGGKSIRVSMSEDAAIDEACGELNRRIPKTESW